MLIHIRHNESKKRKQTNNILQSSVGYKFFSLRAEEEFVKAPVLHKVLQRY